MKKSIFALATCALALAMSSCTGYNDKQSEEVCPFGPNQSGEFTLGQTVNLRQVYAYTGGWMSPDPFVAKVDGNGVVTAMHVGTTYLQATNEDDNNLYYTITVKSTVDFFENADVDWRSSTDDVKGFYDKDPLKNGDNVKEVVIDDTHVMWAYPVETTYTDDDYRFACYAVAVYEKEVIPNEEKPDKPEINYYLVESALVVNALGYVTEDQAATAELTAQYLETLASQLTQWFEPINSPATSIPGLTVYRGYTVAEAPYGVETMPAQTTDWYLFRYFNPAADGKYITADRVNTLVGK